MDVTNVLPILSALTWLWNVGACVCAHVRPCGRTPITPRLTRRPAFARQPARHFPDLAPAESGAGVHYHANGALRGGLRILACTSWALAATMPNGVLIFWITSNVFAIGRGYVTRVNAVRRALRIPLASEIAALPHLPRALP